MKVRYQDNPVIPRVPSVTRRGLLGLAAGVALAWVLPSRAAGQARGTKWPRIPTKPFRREYLYEPHDLAG